MNGNETVTLVPGSERTPMRNARDLGPVRADQALEVTVHLRAADAAVPPHSEATNPTLGTRRYLTREEFALTHGASVGDIATMEQFARAHQLVVVGADQARRGMVLAGTVAAMNAAFHTRLHEFECPQGTYRERTGPLSVPAAIAPIIEGVFGLDDRPQAAPQFRLIYVLTCQLLFDVFIQCVGSRTERTPTVDQSDMRGLDTA